MTVDSSILNAFIGYQVKQTHQFISNRFTKVLLEFNLTPAEVNTLILIHTNPNLTQSGLARTLGIERASLGEVLSKLEKKQMIERISSPTDQRAKTLIISASKKDEFHQIVKAINEHNAEICKGLSDAEQLTLITLLENIRK